MNSEHLSWQAWRRIGVAYGLGWGIGLVVVTEMWLGLSLAYLWSMTWLALTRHKDYALRWFPLCYMTVGLLGLASPFNDYLSLGYVLFAASLVVWVAFLSVATVWIVRRLDRR